MWKRRESGDVPRQRPRGAWRKAAYAVAGILAAAILFVLGGGLMLETLERYLIYFPSRVDRAAPTPRIEGAISVEEVWLQTGDGVQVHGLYARGEGDPLAEVLFFHGNAGSLYDRLDNVSLLLGSGFNVLIMGYRGYGKSEGDPSEEALYADGRLAYRYLTEERGVDSARLVLFGRSLGSTVVIELGGEVRAGALVVESGFTSARALARLHYAWVPGMVLRNMSHQFDSISKAPELKAPVLYVHGLRDTIVPAEMGRRLYEASPEPKEWYAIGGAGHNDTLWVGGDEYLRRLVEFVTRHVGGRG